MSGVEKKIELRFSVVFLNLGRRPYLTHLDVSVENGLFRLKPKSGFLRPFLMQSDLSVENGLFRMKPKSGFLRGLKRAFSTRLFSTENSDWRIQSKKCFFDSTFFD